MPGVSCSDGSTYLGEADCEGTFHVVPSLEFLSTGDDEEAVLNLSVLVWPVLPTLRPASLLTLGRHDNTVNSLLPHLHREGCQTD